MSIKKKYNRLLKSMGLGVIEKERKKERNEQISARKQWETPRSEIRRLQQEEIESVRRLREIKSRKK